MCQKHTIYRILRSVENSYFKDDFIINISNIFYDTDCKRLGNLEDWSNTVQLFSVIFWLNDIINKSFVLEINQFKASKATP